MGQYQGQFIVYVVYDLTLKHLKTGILYFCETNSDSFKSCHPHHIFQLLAVVLGQGWGNSVEKRDVHLFCRALKIAVDDMAVDTISVHRRRVAYELF